MYDIHDSGTRSRPSGSTTTGIYGQNGYSPSVLGAPMRRGVYSASTMSETSHAQLMRAWTHGTWWWWRRDERDEQGGGGRWHSFPTESGEKYMSVRSSGRLRSHSVNDYRPNRLDNLHLSPASYPFPWNCHPPPLLAHCAPVAVQARLWSSFPSRPVIRFSVAEQLQLVALQAFQRASHVVIYANDASLEP